MSIDTLVKSLGLSNSQVDEFSHQLAIGDDLMSLSRILGCSEEKTYCFAKLFCEEILLMSLEDLSPSLVQERKRILVNNMRTINGKKEASAHNRRLSTISEELSLLIYEKKPSRVNC